MNEWSDMVFNGNLGSFPVTIETVLLVSVLSFCVGHLIGWVYMWTHSGLSYSRMFVVSLVVLPVLVAIVMLLMQGGGLIVAFGLLAVFAVVRFRNVLKDTRDTVFILWSIVMGLALGTLNFSTGLVGCVCVTAIMLYLRLTSFGTRHRYDVVLTVHWTGAGRAGMQLANILHRHAARAHLATERAADDEGMDLSYRLLLRDSSRSRELLAELEATEGVAYAWLTQREEDESEI